MTRSSKSSRSPSPVREPFERCPRCGALVKAHRLDAHRLKCPQRERGEPRRPNEPDENQQLPRDAVALVDGLYALAKRGIGNREATLDAAVGAHGLVIAACRRSIDAGYSLEVVRSLVDAAFAGLSGASRVRDGQRCPSPATALAKPSPPTPAPPSIGSIMADRLIRAGFALSDGKQRKLRRETDLAKCLDRVANYLELPSKKMLRRATHADISRWRAGKPARWESMLRELAATVSEHDRDFAKRAERLADLLSAWRPMAPVPRPTSSAPRPSAAKPTPSPPRPFTIVQTANWREIGIPKLYGYHVGRSSTLRDSQRRLLLAEVFAADLSGIPDANERRAWGRPMTLERKDRLERHLRGLRGWAERKVTADMSEAIRDWSEDLVWVELNLFPPR